MEQVATRIRRRELRNTAVGRMKFSEQKTPQTPFLVAMEWELEQLEKLDELKEKYGWADDDKNLQARKKAIMKKGLQRLKASPKANKTLSRMPQADAPEEEEDLTVQKIAWGEGTFIKAKDWEAAYVKLDKIKPGNWKRDKWCPQSKVAGYKARRRILLDAEGNTVDRVRVIDQEDGTFELQFAVDVTEPEDNGDNDSEPAPILEPEPEAEAGAAAGEDKPTSTRSGKKVPPAKQLPEAPRGKRQRKGADKS